MIKLLESIEMQTNVPLDKREIVKTLTERDAIDKTIRYLGMEVYVSDEKKKYRLEDGIENINWVEMKGIVNLSEMTQDDNHMTVTKAEKELWNNKSDANHNHLATEITEDTEHRFTTDAEKTKWNSKAEGNHNHDNVYSKTTHSHAWGDITDKPSEFNPSSHNQASNTINAMTGYTKPSSTGAITATDNLNVAIGKLEKALDGKQVAGNYASNNHNHDSSYAIKNHTHTASQVTGLPTALKNPNALTISLNGTSQGAYDGSVAKNINITPANIGAQVAGNYAASNHTHTAANVGTYTKSEIDTKVNAKANTSHTHSNYLANNTSGTITGNLTLTGELLANGNVTAFSDEKVKKNIVPIDNSVIEKLKLVQFYNYEMINDFTNRKRIGVKAQELELLFPELVFEDKNGIKSVDYIGLNTYFSFAMQYCLMKVLGD